MRYMMMVKATKDSEAGLPPNPKVAAGMGKLCGEMAARGNLLAADGLLPSSQGMRISYSRGKRTVIDGPFSEAKELIGGFAILRAESKSEALELAMKCMDVLVAAGEECEIEVRPISEPGDAGCGQ